MEFQQNEIKRLNEKYNVEIFSSLVGGGKAYAVEEKIRELKKLLFKSKKVRKASSSSKRRLYPKKLIRQICIMLICKTMAIHPKQLTKTLLKTKNLEKFKISTDFLG